MFLRDRLVKRMGGMMDMVRKYANYLLLRSRRLHPYYLLSRAYRHKIRFTPETARAKKRRLRQGFFERFCRGRGIDIGCGPYDRITPDTEGWDRENGDATFMENVPDDTYDYVYSSHCLEHIADQLVALKNWVRIAKAGGHLIIVVPHRDLYEKKAALPSRWNRDHKRFYLPELDSFPDTVSLHRIVDEAIGDQVDWVYLRVCDEGWKPLPDHVHPIGEYQIEAVLRKKEGR